MLLGGSLSADGSRADNWWPAEEREIVDQSNMEYERVKKNSWAKYMRTNRGNGEFFKLLS